MIVFKISFVFKNWQWAIWLAGYSLLIPALEWMWVYFSLKVSIHTRAEIIPEKLTQDSKHDLKIFETKVNLKIQAFWSWHHIQDSKVLPSQGLGVSQETNASQCWTPTSVWNISDYACYQCLRTRKPGEKAQKKQFYFMVH